MLTVYYNIYCKLFFFAIFYSVCTNCIAELTCFFSSNTCHFTVDPVLTSIYYRSKTQQTQRKRHNPQIWLPLQHHGQFHECHLCCFIPDMMEKVCVGLSSRRLQTCPYVHTSARDICFSWMVTSRADLMALEWDCSAVERPWHEFRLGLM